MTAFKSFGLIVILMFFILSCKKEEADTQETPTALAQLCTGNGSDSYYPLAIGNAWYWPGLFGGVYKHIIYRTVEFDSITFYELYNTEGYLWGYLNETWDGNIISHSESDGNNYLLVPAHPIAGQTWQLGNNGSRVVMNPHASLTTSSCHYDDCLLIDDVSASGEHTRSNYYKKGIGLICYRDYGLGGLKWDLIGLELH